MLPILAKQMFRIRKVDIGEVERDNDLTVRRKFRDGEEGNIESSLTQRRRVDTEFWRGRIWCNCNIDHLFNNVIKIKA